MSARCLHDALPKPQRLASRPMGPQGPGSAFGVFLNREFPLRRVHVYRPSIFSNGSRRLEVHLVQSIGSYERRGPSASRFTPQDARVAAASRPVPPGRARAQGSSPLQPGLRPIDAATSLTRLWQRQGKRDAARALYWTPFLGGQFPAPDYAMSLDEEARVALRERIRARLPIAPDGSIPLIARAWAVRGAR
jgi:hypothetical protein